MKEDDYQKESKNPNYVCPLCLAKKKNLVTDGTPVKMPLLRDDHQLLLNKEEINQTETVESPKTDNSTDVEGSKLDLILKRINNILKEQVDMSRALTEIQTTLEENTNNIKSIENRLLTIETRLDEVNQINHETKQRLDKVDSRLNKLEQNYRRNILEIHGLPFDKAENLENTVREIGSALGMDIQPNDIDFCTRTRPKISTMDPPPPPAILVKFVRQTVRNEMLRLRKVKTDFSTRHLNSWSGVTNYSIYINESLTPYYKWIYGLARNLQRRNKIKFLWVKDCKILARKKEGDPVKLLGSEDDVNTFA